MDQEPSVMPHPALNSDLHYARPAQLMFKRKAQMVPESDGKEAEKKLKRNASGKSLPKTKKPGQAPLDERTDENMA